MQPNGHGQALKKKNSALLRDLHSKAKSGKSLSYYKCFVYPLRWGGGRGVGRGKGRAGF